MERGVRRRGDKSERKSFHSFRVNVVTQLANNGANTIQVMRIVGHASGSAGVHDAHGLRAGLAGLEEGRRHAFLAHHLSRPCPDREMICRIGERI